MPASYRCRPDDPASETVSQALQKWRLPYPTHLVCLDAGDAAPESELAFGLEEGPQEVGGSITDGRPDVADSATLAWVSALIAGVRWLANNDPYI